MIRFAPALLVLALDVFCLIDVITSDEDRVRHLPKIAWFLLILFFPLIGSIVWLLAGRPQRHQVGYGSAASAAYPEYDRPGRFHATNPDDDEEFLRKVRERAEAQTAEAKRQRAERERLEREASERERAARQARERELQERRERGTAHPDAAEPDTDDQP